MPAPFKQLTREQFAELLKHFRFTRKINAVHMHHTWRPERSMYRGHDTIEAMWRHHTQVNGWSDIAQHISIAPDGTIWLGRDWNRPPASAAGHNGNLDAGPFMFEMIGNFDRGCDPFDGEQHRTAIEVIARVQMRFGMPPGTLQFHNMMSSKSCPGTSIDYHAVLQEVAELHQQLMTSREAPPAADEMTPERQAMRRVVLEAAEDLARPTGRGADPADAEPCRDTHGHESAGERVARGRGFTPAELAALRPHVVNLRQGEFSDSGEWTTSSADVDALFDGLAVALEEAQAAGRKLKLMMYAHGGLVSEEAALNSARDHLDWWRANGIYPIYFVWETGLGETLGQILDSARRRAAPGTRNFFSDRISDPLIEQFVRVAGGPRIWAAMQASARRASEAHVLGGVPPSGRARPGGAWYVAQKLGRFCEKHGGDVEIHACGHSAGAIFHSWFVPCALAAGVPRFHTVHLLAPAVRADLFHQQLAPEVGKRIDRLTMYTMSDTFEKNDQCAQVYRKSLLYLIHKALEPERDEAILGLERSVRADPALQQLFGPGTPAAAANVVWSQTAASQGLSASRATEHGAFDDDPATLGSIARRVLGKADADRIVEYQAPRERGGIGMWEPAPLPEWVDEYFAPQAAPLQPEYGLTSGAGMAGGAPVPSAGVASGASGAPAGGRRIALCVGIDTYPTAPLGGCVNDANAWSAALGRLGFHATQLLNGQATRAAIVAALRRLVEDSGPGDNLVFQYSGHGTQVPQVNPRDDEGDGLDEAMCPFDFASGALLIDNDLRAIFGRLPPGASLTCFFDCCHSGTITRMALGAAPGGRSGGKRARFVRADTQLVSRYLRRRTEEGVAPDAPRRMGDVSFAACMASELALESDGHGDFTRHALRVLGAAPQGLTNEAFAGRVTAAFGSNPNQHAKLYADKEAFGLPFLNGAVMPATIATAEPPRVSHDAWAYTG